MAHEHWLDTLSRGLARGISRKDFLRLLGSAALAALLPGPIAGARQRRPCSDGCLTPFADCCGEFCTNVDIDVSNCGGCGQPCAPGLICRSGRCIAVESPPTLEPQPSPCQPPCPASQVCIVEPGRAFCCDQGLACLNTCYASPPRRCEEGLASWCCPAEQTCCAGACCSPLTTCRPHGPNPISGDPCCPTEKVCGDSCCWGETECVDGACRPICTPPCGPGQVCIQNLDFISHPEGISCCDVENVWLENLCCPVENRYWTIEGYILVPECCPPEQQCPEGCCGAGQRCEGGQCVEARGDCPPERQCGDICCSETERCEEGRCIPKSLNGIWLDEDLNAEVRIVHSGNTVSATYLVERTCDHRDGTGNTSQTDFSFAGTIEGNEIEGETSACNWGEENPLGVGWTRTQIRLTIAGDWKRLAGDWFNQSSEVWLGISFRKLSDEGGQAVGGGRPGLEVRLIRVRRPGRAR